MSKIFHYTFSTYKRKQILVGEIARKLEGIFEYICKEKGFEMICQSILADHVHLLIKKNSSDQNEYVMKMIKGKSAYLIFKEFPSDRFKYRKLWGRGYRAKEVGGAEEMRVVIDYIGGQRIKGIDKRVKANWKPRRLVAGFQ